MKCRDVQLLLFGFILLFAPLCACCAADGPQSIFGKDMQDFADRLTKAMGQKDDSKIKALVETDQFTTLAMANPSMTILLAVAAPSYTVLDALIKNHVNINAPLPPGIRTALHYAVGRNDPQMVEYLLEHGSDPFRIDESYSTALDRCMRGAQHDCAVAILKHLREGGTLDVYLRWETTLSDVRKTLETLNPRDAAKEGDLLPEIQKLSEEK